MVKCLAAGRNPQEMKAGEFAEGKPATIGADDSVEEAMQTMARAKVRRLPVIDGHDLIGMVSQADGFAGSPLSRLAAPPPCTRTGGRRRPRGRRRSPR